MNALLQRNSVERDNLFGEFAAMARTILMLESQGAMRNGAVAPKAKFSMLQRLQKWLVQLGFLKAREKKILSKIDVIERMHKQLKQEKRLKTIDSKEALAQKEKGRSSKWLWALLIMFEMDRKRPIKVVPAPRNG